MKTNTFIAVLLMTVLSGCMMPNTYYDPSDPYALGLRWYDRGRFDLAAKYWEPLLEEDDCDAEYRMGLLYFLGQARPQSNTETIRLWRKAANANHPKAQGAMGDLYYQNTIFTFHDCADCKIEKDLIQAYVWYRLLEKSARYDGEEDYASRIIDRIITEMDKEQIIKADELVEKWEPTPNACTPRSWW